MFCRAFVDLGVRQCGHNIHPLFILGYCLIVSAIVVCLLFNIRYVTPPIHRGFLDMRNVIYQSHYVL